MIFLSQKMLEWSNVKRRSLKRITTWQGKLGEFGTLKVIPSEIGALGTSPEALKSSLEKMGVSIGLDYLHKSVLLGTTRILDCSQFLLS